MQHVVRAGVSQELNLQATLSTSSAGHDLDGGPVVPHHPITCAGRLWLHEDGRFECEHAQAPPGDHRTRTCLDHSIALLIIELAMDKLMS